MRRAHRTLHTLAWTVGAVVLIVVVAAAWFVRPAEPTNTLPPAVAEALEER